MPDGQVALSDPSGEERRSLQGKAIRGAMWTGLHTVISLPVAVGVNLVIARVLGVVDYGRLAYLTLLITTIGSIAALGVDTATLQFGAKAHAAGRHGEVRELLSASSGWRLLVGAPVVSLAVVLLVDLDGPMLLAGLLFGVWIPSALGGLGIALNIENKTARGAQLAIVINLVTQCAALVALFGVRTADAVWLARLMAGSASVVLLYFFIDRRYRRAVLAPRNPFRLPRAFWRFAIPTGLAAIISGLVTSRSGVLLLEWFGDPVSVGLFGLAFGVATHIFAPAQALVGPLIPAVSSLSEVEPGALPAALLRSLRCSAALVALVSAAALPLLSALVPVLYGSAFGPAADMVLVLGVVTAVSVVTAPLSAFLFARLGGMRLLVTDSLCLAISVGLAAALIPHLGAWGAIVSFAGGTLARTAILLRSESSVLGVRGGQLIPTLGPLLIMSAVVSLTWIWTASLASQPILRAAILFVVDLPTIILGARLARWGLHQPDVEALRRALPPRLQYVASLALRPMTVRESDPTGLV